MKITNARLVGRYINPETGRPVNIHRGKCAGGWSRYWYFYRQKRVFVGEEFWKWEKKNPT